MQKQQQAAYQQRAVMLPPRIEEAHSNRARYCLYIYL